MLRERILQLLEKRDDIDQRKLARIAGLSESSISRFLHGYEEANFESVLKLVQYLFPEEEVEFMVEHIMTQKSRNARLGLEYCAMHKCWEQIDDLIELLSNSTNPLDKEWAGMYDLIRMEEEKLIPSFDILQKVEMFKPKELEMQILKTILKGYLYFEMGEYHSLSLHMKGIESQIQEINSSFIQESFYVRLSLIMSIVKLNANYLEKSKHYNYTLIGQDLYENRKAAAYNNLGNCYMFENYEKSKGYFTKALDYFVTSDDEVNKKIVKLNLSFLYSFWDVEREFTESLDNHESYANYIYYLIKKGEMSLAQEYLSKIDTEKITEWDKGFYYYYKGLLTQDITTFYYSADAFLKANNYFYLQLPLIELLKLGENEEALKILSKRGNFNEEDNKNPIRK